MEMVWFCNHYKCERCGCEWMDEWSAMSDDDCPDCGYRHMTPFDSEHLTYIVTEENGAFAVLYSPESAEHYPDYFELARFPTREQAEAVRKDLAERLRQQGY